MINSAYPVQSTPPRAEGQFTETWQRRKVGKAPKLVILIRMQFLNDIIKSRHGFKTAQKFYKFRVFIKKTLNL